MQRTHKFCEDCDRMVIFQFAYYCQRRDIVVVYNDNIF